MKVSDKEVDKIIDELNEGTYKSSAAATLDRLKKDDNLMAAIDTIVNESKSVEEIQCKTIMAIQEHAKNITPEKLTAKEMGMEERKIAKDIAKLTRDITAEKINKKSPEQKDEFKGAKLDKQKDDNKNITDKSKEDLKQNIKRFAIYEVYKVMNPRRIAGETKKDNYQHNMMIGGEKLASKHTGGKEHEVKSYSKKFVKNTKTQAKSFKKNGGFER